MTMALLSPTVIAGSQGESRLSDPREERLCLRAHSSGRPPVSSKKWTNEGARLLSSPGIICKAFRRANKEAFKL